MCTSVCEALQLLGFTDLQGSLPPANAIRRAFRQQALLWHPDKHHGPSHGGDFRPSAPSAAGAVTASTATTAGASGSGHGPALHRNNHTQAQAAEHFKRLAAAYHLLLQQAADGASPSQGAAAAAGGVGGVGGGAGGVGGGREQEEAAEEEKLLDELSVELLLLEAQKLRLSDFDMVFLHQRASGAGADASASAASSVWPEAAQSVDDVWRRIRRRVERRRRRWREGAAAGAAAANGTPGIYAGATSGGGRPGVGAKWALLSEFLADVVGATAAPACAPPHPDVDEPERPATPPGRADGGAAAAWVEEPADSPVGRGAAGDSCSQQLQQQEQEALRLGLVVVAGGEGSHAAGVVRPQPPPPRPRPRGRLPPGFYWRWLKRLVAARLLFFVFFKG